MHDFFITHVHTDHLLGAPWVIRVVSDLMNRGEYEGDCNVWCHAECLELLSTLCHAAFGGKQARNLDTRIRFRLLEDGTEFSAAGMALTAFDIGSHKTRQFGFRAILPDGQILTCLGDEPCHGPGEPYVRGCDWLLTEAFCLYEDRDRFHPYEKFHSTVRDAARKAQALGVKNLLLYHTEDQTLPTRRIRYTAEARTVFTGNVLVPEDLEVISLS